MTLYKDIMPYFDKLIHVYGQLVIIKKIIIIIVTMMMMIIIMIIVLIITMIIWITKPPEVLYYSHHIYHTSGIERLENWLYSKQCVWCYWKGSGWVTWHTSQSQQWRARYCALAMPCFHSPHPAPSWVRSHAA